MRARFLVLLGLIPLVAIAADFVGAETCKSCHPAAYDVWKESAHSRAQEALPEKSRNDPRCTACHAPESERGVANVTCESCHGAGQFYAPKYVMRDKELARAVGLVDPNDKTCATCHTEAAPSLTRFDFAKKAKLIEHGIAERASRKK